MVQLKLSSVWLFFAISTSSSVSHVQAAPVQKRSSQTYAPVDPTVEWTRACIAAGGSQQCDFIAVIALATLSTEAGPCEQQDAADSMVDLAKQLNKDSDMIKFAQIFAQEPRDTPSSQSVPYCQRAPQNSELAGVFQCQYQSSDEELFIGGASLGSAGTIPSSLEAPVSPAGSCPANPDGPITDEWRLVAITLDPGAVGTAVAENDGSGSGGGDNGSGGGGDNGNGGGGDNGNSGGGDTGNGGGGDH